MPSHSTGILVQELEGYCQGRCQALCETYYNKKDTDGLLTSTSKDCYHLLIAIRIATRCNILRKSVRKNCRSNISKHARDYLQGWTPQGRFYGQRTCMHKHRIHGGTSYTIYALQARERDEQNQADGREERTYRLFTLPRSCMKGTILYGLINCVKSWDMPTMLDSITSLDSRHMNLFMIVFHRD